MISLPLNSVLLFNFSFMNRCMSLLFATESTSMGSKPYRFLKIYILHKHQLFFIVHVYLRTEYFQIQYYIQLAQTRHIYVGQCNSSFNYLTTLLSHILGTVPGNLYSEIKDSQFQTNHFLKERTEKATKWDFFLSRRKIRILSRHTELCSKPSPANKGLANKRVSTSVFRVVEGDSLGREQLQVYKTQEIHKQFYTHLLYVWKLKLRGNILYVCQLPVRSIDVDTIPTYVSLSQA